MAKGIDQFKIEYLRLVELEPQYQQLLDDLKQLLFRNPRIIRNVYDIINSVIEKNKTELEAVERIGRGWIPAYASKWW